MIMGVMHCNEFMSSLSVAQHEGLCSCVVRNCFKSKTCPSSQLNACFICLSHFAKHTRFMQICHLTFLSLSPSQLPVLFVCSYYLISLSTVSQSISLSLDHYSLGEAHQFLSPSLPLFLMLTVYSLPVTISSYRCMWVCVGVFVSICITQLLFALACTCIWGNAF